MRALVSLMSAVLTLCAGPLAQAADPVRAIPYAGKLEVDGSAPSASFTMDFALFDAGPAGTGTNLWNETMTVAVTSGAFAVVLGSTASNPLPDSVFLAGALYIEVTVDPAGSKTVLAPRQQIYAAPQAIRGRTTDNFTITGGLEMGLPGVPATIHGANRLHLFTEEILYLLAKGGVIIASNWGGPGTLSVENAISSGSLTTGNLTASGAATAGSLTIGDLQLRAANGVASHISGSNGSGHLFLDNRPTATDGRIFLNYNSGKPVTFGNHRATVDATTGDVSAEGSVTVKGGIKSHSDVATRCQTPSNQCAGDGYSVTCPAGMYVQSFWLRAGNCSTVTCCYPDT